MTATSLPDATQNPRFTGIRSFMRLPAPRGTTTGASSTAFDPTQTTALLAATLVFQFIAPVALDPKKTAPGDGRPRAAALS